MITLGRIRPVTKTYDIKIDARVTVTLWYDRNFTIEADSEAEAEEKAHKVAQEQLKDFEFDVDDIEVANDGSWTYGDQLIDYQTVHVMQED